LKQVVVGGDGFAVVRLRSRKPERGIETSSTARATSSTRTVSEVENPNEGLKQFPRTACPRASRVSEVENPNEGLKHGKSPEREFRCRRVSEVENPNEGLKLCFRLYLCRWIYVSEVENPNEGLKPEPTLSHPVPYLCLRSRKPERGIETSKLMLHAQYLFLSQK